MKKILVALALAAVASTASAAVENSKHDFNQTGSTYTVGTKFSRCMYCHVPHNAQTWAETGLWALPEKDISSLSFYNGGTVDDRETVTCLGCHMDGAVAESGLGAVVASSALVGGGDLTNDHPIGSGTRFTVGTTRGIRATEFSLAYQTFTVGSTHTVECGTCHNPHNSNVVSGSKMVALPAGAGVNDFCNACHTR